MTYDAFGYSPDVGSFVIRDDKMYTEHGRVYEAHERTMIRSMPLTAGSHENYADWPAEKRAQVLAAATKEYEEHKKAKEAEHAARLELVEAREGEAYAGRVSSHR